MGRAGRVRLPNSLAGPPRRAQGLVGADDGAGVAFELDAAGRARGALVRLRRIDGVTTYRSPAWSVRAMGDAGRRTLTRALRLSCRRPWQARCTWLALHRCDTAGPQVREAFLRRVDAALCRRVTEVLLDGGHVIDLVDLHAADFGRAGADVLADHRRRVAAADGLVFVHPTWWGGQPAILKRWLDEVLCEGVAYRVDGRGRRRSLLRHIRLLVVVTTYGSSRWVNLLEGEPGRRTARWGLRALLSWRARSRWLACYRMDVADEEVRRRFLDRVGRELGRIER